MRYFTVLTSQSWIIVTLSDGFGCSKPEWLISVRFNLNRLLGRWVAYSGDRLGRGSW